MKHSERLEIFEKVRAEHSVFLLSVLWKLTGDKELFTEAMQYTLMGMWQHIEKLNGKKAGAYIYRIALTANSRAWRGLMRTNGRPAWHSASRAILIPRMAPKISVGVPLEIGIPSIFSNAGMAWSISWRATVL